MNVWEALRVGLLEIRAHKLQSLLTVFGIAVGITSVTVMTGMMSGFRGYMAAGIERAGPGRIFVWPQSDMANRALSSGLTYDDALAIRRRFPWARAVSPSLEGTDNIFFDDYHAKVHVRGITPDWRKVDWNYSLAGRFIDAEDVRTFAKVCVLIKKRHTKLEFWRQNDALDPLFKKGDMVGKEVRLGDVAFRVVGVITEGPRDFMMNFDMGQKNVLVPITSLSKRISDVNRVLWLIDVDSGDRATSALLAARVRALLKRRHRGISDFRIENVAEKMGAALTWSVTLSTVMGLVAAIALFAGGVGIMNITLASVADRIKEIGVRKSVGARERDIQLQFLAEAAALSLIGGGLGASVGLAACLVVKAVASIPAMPSTAVLVGALLLAAAVGILSAWYPARQAARMDPVEALRSE
ncbi:MAG: ABC transporter permease [Elusimicrobia bacterium]|nr:ABC transporter permease [Elusimicrobiota bacterium]